MDLSLIVSFNTAGTTTRTTEGGTEIRAATIQALIKDMAATRAADRRTDRLMVNTTIIKIETIKINIKTLDAGDFFLFAK